MGKGLVICGLFLIIYLTVQLYATATVKVTAVSSNVPADVDLPQENVAARLCTLNAALGAKANAAITALCKKSEVTSHTCLPLPTLPDIIQDNQQSFSDRLINGGLEMKKQITSVDDKIDEAVFIFGNFASGKTDATQILTQNLSSLHFTKTKTGEFVILNSKSKSLSQIIPGYFKDPGNGTVFIDCPGFGDGRTYEMETAATYFLKTALDSVPNHKYIFTVDHSSVKLDNDDDRSFDKFVTYVTRIFKNFENISQSIGLVVTNVVGRSTDDAVLQQIREYLEIYRQTCKDLLNSHAQSFNTLETQNKQKFVEILLDLNGTRIGFLRKPQYCGPLSKSSDAIKAKKTLTDLYSQRLQYSATKPQDFGFPLNPFTIQEITKFYIPTAVQNIRKNVQLASANLTKYFLFDAISELKLVNNTNKTVKHKIINLDEQLKTFLQTLRGNGSYDETNSLHKFSQALANLLNFVEVGDQKERDCLINGINEIEKQLDFYLEVTQEKLKTPHPSWFQPLIIAYKQIAKIQGLYDYFEKLETEINTIPKQACGR